MSYAAWSCLKPYTTCRLQGEDSDDEAETDEAALASIDSWQPDPIDADPSRSARSRRMHDIISMLVGIYGSKELFITEYRYSVSSWICMSHLP